MGHSLGGLIPRIYASDNYQKPHAYLRHENFRQGDINRLITIATPHHGSDLPRIAGYLAGVKIGEVALHEWAAAHAGVWAADLLMSTSATAGAAIDQIPESAALRKIGATRVPAHAIAAIAEAPRGTAVEPIVAAIESFLLRPIREDSGKKGPNQLMDSFLEDFRAFREKERHHGLPESARASRYDCDFILELFH